MITHKAVLKKMQDGKPFSITYRSFNKQEKKGGKLKELHTAKKITKSAKKSSANHFEHHTFNVIAMADGQEIGRPLKVHLMFILFFNGESCTP